MQWFTAIYKRKKMELTKLLDYCFAATVRFLAVGAQLFLVLVVSRTLSPAESGSFFLALGVVSVLAAVSTLGIENLLIVKVSTGNYKSLKQRIELCLYLVAPMILLSFIASLGIAEFFTGWDGFVYDGSYPILLQTNIIYIMSAITGTVLLASAIQGLGQVNLSIMVARVFLPLSVAVIVATDNPPTFQRVSAIYETMAWTTLVGTVFVFAVVRYSKSLLNSSSKASQQIENKLDKCEVTALIIIAISSQILIWSGTLLGGILLGNEAASILLVVQRCVLAINFVLITLNAIDAPKFARAYSNGDIESLQQRAETSAKLAVFFGTLIFIIFLYFANDILLVFGEEYYGNQHLVWILSIATLFNCMCGPVNTLLMMTNNRKISALSAVVCLTVIWVTSELLAPVWGVLGVVVGISLGILMRNLVDVYFVWKKLGFVVFFPTLVKCFYRQKNFDA